MTKSHGQIGSIQLSRKKLAAQRGLRQQHQQKWFGFGGENEVSNFQTIGFRMFSHKPI